MKVICIDNEPYPTTQYPEDIKKLKIGEEYTVVGYPHPEGYLLAELNCRNRMGFYSKRFAPLSDIDEKEFERNYNFQTV